MARGRTKRIIAAPLEDKKKKERVRVNKAKRVETETDLTEGNKNKENEKRKLTGSQDNPGARPIVSSNSVLGEERMRDGF